MVSTRNHPTTFPAPDLSSPSGRPSTRSTTGSTSDGDTPEPTASPTKPRARRSQPLRRVSKPASGNAELASPGTQSQSVCTWAHTPSHIVLLWLTVSLPLVLWDTGYILLRPHSMPNGKLHSPIWTPYAVYARVDYVYGFPAWEEKDGFPAAQSSMNLIETAVYFAYLWAVAKYGTESRSVEGRGWYGMSWWGRARVMKGREAGVAVLLGLVGSLMTASKTMLYALNEYNSDFKHTAHNTLVDIIFCYIIPNGAWLVFSTWMTYVFSVEILEGLAVAAGEDPSESKVLALKED